MYRGLKKSRIITIASNATSRFMQKRENFIPFFLVFFGLSLVLILIGKSGVLNGVISIINRAAYPPKTATLNIFGFQNEAIKKLSEENTDLQKKAAENQNLTAENKALRDQFAVSGSRSQDLLPAQVVGAPGFIPGVSLPEYLIIDKGLKDNVVLEDAIVVGNNLVGKVIKTEDNFSKVELLNHQGFAFAGKVASEDGREVSGIIRGKGSEELIFENVLLTLSLKKGDIVLTKGEKDEKGVGYPPDLIVGKITSVEKKPADLFQKAQVVSFVDFSNLTTVFVIR